MTRDSAQLHMFDVADVVLAFLVHVKAACQNLGSRVTSVAPCFYLG
jgi:hypothetical protein